MDYIVIQPFFSKTAAQSRFKLNSRDYYLIFIILVNSLAAAISVNTKVDRCLQGEDLNALLYNAAEHREPPLI